MLLVATEAGKQLKLAANGIADRISADLLRSVDAALVIDITQKLEALRAQLDAHLKGRS